MGNTCTMIKQILILIYPYRAPPPSGKYADQIQILIYSYFTCKCHNMYKLAPIMSIIINNYMQINLYQITRQGPWSFYNIIDLSSI